MVSQMVPVTHIDPYQLISTHIAHQTSSDNRRDPERFLRLSWKWIHVECIEDLLQVNCISDHLKSIALNVSLPENTQLYELMKVNFARTSNVSS